MLNSTHDPKMILFGKPVQGKYSNVVYVTCKIKIKNPKHMTLAFPRQEDFPHTPSPPSH